MEDAIRPKESKNRPSPPSAHFSLAIKSVIGMALSHLQLEEMIRASDPSQGSQLLMISPCLIETRDASQLLQRERSAKATVTHCSQNSSFPEDENY